MKKPSVAQLKIGLVVIVFAVVLSAGYQVYRVYRTERSRNQAALACDRAAEWRMLQTDTTALLTADEKHCQKFRR